MGGRGFHKDSPEDLPASRPTPPHPVHGPGGREALGTSGAGRPEDGCVTPLRYGQDPDPTGHESRFREGRTGPAETVPSDTPQSLGSPRDVRTTGRRGEVDGPSAREHWYPRDPTNETQRDTPPKTVSRGSRPHSAETSHSRTSFILHSSGGLQNGRGPCPLSWVCVRSGHRRKVHLGREGLRRTQTSGTRPGVPHWSRPPLCPVPPSLEFCRPRARSACETVGVAAPLVRGGRDRRDPASLH